MKILLLHTCMVIGGIERVLLSYMKIFKALNYHTDVLLIYDINGEDSLQQELASQYNVNYVLSNKKTISIFHSKRQKHKALKHKLYYEYHRFMLNKKLNDNI